MVNDKQAALREDLVSALGEVKVKESSHLKGILVARVSASREVGLVLDIARRHQSPLLPRAPGIDITGVKPPTEGGILLDLGPMNRLLEINHNERYAVVEPGLTWRTLENRLLEDGGDLALPVTCAPSRTGPWATCLVDGAEGTGLALGHVGRMVWGVEALVPTGEIVQTGVRSITESWWGRGPYPDLTTLFRRWRGATGIVTRISVSLRHRRRHIRRILIPSNSKRVAIAASIRLTRTRLFEESYVIPNSLMHVLLGNRKLNEQRSDEPQAWLAVDFFADSLPELEYKRVRLAHALSRASRRGGAFDDPMPLNSLIRAAPSLESLEDLPISLTDRNTFGNPETGEGPRILGFHGPVSILVDGADAAEEVYGLHGLLPVVMVRPIPGGHHGLIHIAVPKFSFRDKTDTLNNAEADTLHRLCALGFLPQRYPSELSEPVKAKISQGAKLIVERLRMAFDPLNVLDPDRWGLPRP